MRPCAAMAVRGATRLGQAVFGTAWSKLGLTTRGNHVHAAGRSLLLGFLNSVLCPAEPRTCSSGARENGFVKTCGI